MANEELLAVFKTGVVNWNAWRKRNNELPIDLSEAMLKDVDISGGADLGIADFHDADLQGVNFSQADLKCANFQNANLQGANLRGADLRGADLRGALLTETNLTMADLRETDLRAIDLQGANLFRANLREADLSKANLCEADLSEANLIGTTLNNANLTRATLSRCKVFGISVWDAKLDQAIQKGLIITPKWDASPITVDNLEVAQFIYLLLNNSKLRDVINTMTGKSVLLLGRFGEGRKAILDAMADWLRAKDLLPITMDFGQPDNKDFTETVRTLAGLCKYVIADLTLAQSVQVELSHIVPFLKMPIIPIIENGRPVFPMFRDLAGYPWVLPLIEYEDQQALIGDMQEKIIGPAEKKHAEIEARKMALWP